MKHLWSVRAPPRTPQHSPDVVWDIILEQDRSETKKSVLVLVLQVMCCIVKYNLVTLVVIMILEDTAAFQVLVWFLYFVLGASLLWRSTVTFTYLKVKSTKCLCLLPVCTSFGLGLVILVLVLVLRIWSCLHHCKASELVEVAAPSPMTLLRSLPSASIFGPSGLIRQPLPPVFHFPNA